MHPTAALLGAKPLCASLCVASPVPIRGEPCPSFARLAGSGLGAAARLICGGTNCCSHSCCLDRSCGLADAAACPVAWALCRCAWLLVAKSAFACALMALIRSFCCWPFGSWQYMSVVSPAPSRKKGWALLKYKISCRLHCLVANSAAAPGVPILTDSPVSRHLPWCPTRPCKEMADHIALMQRFSQVPRW